MRTHYSKINPAETAKAKAVLRSHGQPDTIVGQVLWTWKNLGRVANWWMLMEAYLQASKFLGYNCNPRFTGMNLLRILKKHGKKCGAPGTKTPWVLQSEV